MSSSSTKKKANSRISAEVELISVDDNTSEVMWKKRFTEAQGFKANLNIVFEHNARTIKLVEN